MTDTNPVYRNKRNNYYSDKFADSMPIGSIVQVLKSKSNTFDNKFIPTDIPQTIGTTTLAYLNIVGDANPADNPEYQYEGYLYCDGSEYNINDYPLLFSIIGNDYGGTPGTGVFNAIDITVTKENVLRIWPSDTLGTFKVPDLKAKKIVGNGPVWGPGTPTIGLNELTVGLGSIDGSWYLDKRSQKQQFSLGRITTTGYDDVIATVPAYISGSQTVRVKTLDTRLSGPPDHTHLLLHSIPSNDDPRPQRGLFDGYLRNYVEKQGRLINFTPSGGLALRHSHGLSRRAFTDNTIATYDTYNYSGGDEGIGTIKSPGFYWASTGISGGGTFEQRTSTTDPLIKTFTPISVIGGVEIVTAGIPDYESTGAEWTSAVTGATITIPSDTESVLLTVRGGSGSGAVGSIAGNNGGQTKIMIGDGSIATITATGGTGGKAGTTDAASNTGTGGSPGTNGSVTFTSSSLSPEQYSLSIAATTQEPTAGGAGPFWKGTYAATSSIPSGNKSKGGIIGPSAGSAGDTRFISNVANTTFGPYTSDATVTIGRTQPYYVFGSPTFEVAGGNGASVAIGYAGCGDSARGGGGGLIKFTLQEVDGGYPTYTWQFKIGQTPPYRTQFDGNSGHSKGGNGGQGQHSGDGAMGGAGGGSTSASIIAEGGVKILVAGAGGGGGQGGWDSGGVTPRDCGFSGGGSSTLYEGNEILFGGDGAVGGTAGCVGGGGGGGGGGIGPGEGGGGKGGVGGPASHGGGGGGEGGRSALRTTYAVKTAFSSRAVSRSSADSGYVEVTSTEDRSYWESYGGGGGAGGSGEVRIPRELLGSATQATINVGGAGSAPTGGTAGSVGYASVIFQKIIGYSGAETDLSVGDIVESASPGITVISGAGTGIGNSGGFTLPTSQVPTVVIGPPVETSGIQATATAVVSGGAVTSVTVTNGGSGYKSVPPVYFYGGAGAGTIAVAQIDSGVIVGIDVISSTPHTRYVKISGDATERYIILKPVNTTKIIKLGIKVARGNNVNGGDLPEDGGDELSIFYNTDGSDDFPNYIDRIVPIPSPTQLSSVPKYDGEAGNTQWYTYTVNLPPAAKDVLTKFKIVQNRSAATGANDNAGNTDHYGIAEIIYYYGEETKLEFITSSSSLPTSIEQLEYRVQGEANNLYTAGIQASDLTFALTSATPLIPYATIQPKERMPLLEPYALVKHLIKAF